MTEMDTATEEEYALLCRFREAMQDIAMAVSKEHGGAVVELTFTVNVNGISVDHAGRCRAMDSSQFNEWLKSHQVWNCTPKPA